MSLWRAEAAVLVVAGAALAGPAQPAAAESCAQGQGVTVVVDFAALGGGTVTGCAPGDPTSGVAALQAGGFTPTRAVQEPGYFLCRIDGKPADDPCQRASPSNAYWSYWHAEPGGSWTYSNTGPAGYDPKPGSVEGWAFGAGSAPSTVPPRPVAAPTTPPASAASPAAPPAAPASPVAVPPAAPGGETAPRTTAPAEPAGTAADTTAAEPRTGTAEPMPAGQPAQPVTIAPTSEPTAVLSPSPVTSPSVHPAASAGTDDGGSPAGPIAAAVLVALLLGGAGWQVWTRRDPTG